MNTDKTMRRLDVDPLWLLRIFTVIPAALILLAGLGTLWIYFFVLSLLPEGQSVVDIPDLQANVQVVRDANGIPGILGDNEEDVAVVFGYVMAQDRLWQMDYLRRAAQGRLAEILGRDFVEGDHLVRTIRAGTEGERQAIELDERGKRWLACFVKGVNRFITRHSGKLPVEFSFLEYRPDLFTPEDVLDICQILAWESSPAHRIDPVLTSVLGRLGPDRARAFFPGDPAAPVGATVADLVGWEPTGLLFSQLDREPYAVRFPGLRGGSAWAVGRAKTVSGKPMSACAVYQDLAAPDFWYRARLAAGDFLISGAFIPGVPLAVAGGNGRISWGCITAPADDADLYVEKVNSNNPTRYWKIDRWHDLKVSKQTYRIRHGSTLTKTIRVTNGGPIVSNVHGDTALSLRWTGLERQGLFTTLHALNRARNGGDVRSALKTLVAPCMDVVWTDEGGNFGRQLAGRIPVRPPDSDGIVPMPSWTGVHDWRGFIPFEELPSETNPRNGTTVAADGRLGGDGYPLFTGCYWSPSSRVHRIRELVGHMNEHYRESFQTIQTDTYSTMAQKLTPLVLQSAKAGSGKSPTETSAMEVLGSWDFQMKRDSAGAAIFSLVYRSILAELFAEQLGPQRFAQFTDCHPIPMRIVMDILLKGTHQAGAPIDRNALMGRSFKKAIATGTSLMGDKPSAWKWGDLHKTVFRHPLTARSRFLEILYQVGPVAVQGSEDTIDHSGWSTTHAFLSLDGVSLRHVSDMTEPPQAFAISSMGSSAHFFSPHYKDQLRPWANGRSFRDPVAQADIRKNGFNAVLFRAGNQKS